MAVARLDVNLFDSSVVADPFPVYERIRQTGRLVWNDILKCWMVPGFEDGTAVLTDSGERFTPRNGDPGLISWLSSGLPPPPQTTAPALV
jgi:hypothetical protein